MSENLSIEEIIRRAKEIKAEASKQLEIAEQNLNKRAEAAVEEVTVDETAVAARIAEATKTAAPDEDIKVYKPENEEDVKVFGGAVKTEDGEEEDIKEYSAPADGKTRSAVLDTPLGKTNIVDLSEKPAKKAEHIEDDGKTREVSFVSTKPESTDENNDLQKAPTIVAKEHIESFNEAQSSDFEEEIGEQITFEGFDDTLEEVDSIDEEIAEQELEERRKEKIGKFRLFGPDETDSELGEELVEEDYEDQSEKSTFLQGLYSKKNAVFKKLIVTAVTGLLLFLMTVLKDSVYFPSFLTGHSAYFLTATILYVITVAVNFNIISHGFRLKKGINFDFPVSLVSLGILAHTVALWASSSLWIDNGVLLASAGSFSLFMSQLGKFRMMSRIVDNFEFITEGSGKYTVENITNSVDAGIISRGLIEEEPMLKMSVKTDFPTNFLEISCKNEPADVIAKRPFIILFPLCLALFFVVGFTDNFNTAFNVLICALAISCPSAALFITNSMLCDISSQLSDFNSRVCGFEGAAMAENANGIVLEASDLFGKDSCDLHGIKMFGGAKVDDAIINAAAVIIQTKSPLAHVFDDVIIGQQSILPKAEEVQYEEKLGTSAWIYKRKVLVGTRDLLRAHGVDVPKESFEQKYTIKGRKALYLAVGGKITAMFIVSYSPDPDLKHELKKLEKSGITVIVKSADPFINEESIAEMFSLPEGFIRVMNYSAARAYDKYSGLNVEKSPAYVVHDGSALGFISAMRGAKLINSSKGLISFLVAFGSALGLIAVALLSILQSYSSITAASIIIFQLIWSAFMLLITRLKGLGL